MPQQPNQFVEANFSKGFITEATTLTFPEDAVSDAQNCIFNRIGNVTRRLGIDFEANAALYATPRENLAVNTYKWNNAGGDGLTQVVVQQIGHHLHFYLSSSATVAAPLSAQKLGTVFDMTTLPYTASLDLLNQTECQFTDGNGYLFVFHPYADPFYCTYSAGTITTTAIDRKIRDFSGVPELGVRDQDRPSTLTDAHKYNLINQGWSAAPLWTTSSTTSVSVGTGSRTFTVATGLTTIPFEIVQINGVGSRSNPALNGSLTSYNSGTGEMIINVTSLFNPDGLPTYDNWSLAPYNAGLIDHWHTDEGNYPSNSDIWWRFKDATGSFNPTTTQPNVTLSAGAAPKGYFLLDPFVQDKGFTSGIGVTINPIATPIRPRTGTWFAGRLWMAGVDYAQTATGNAPYTTWTENIYFSQVAVDATAFGKFYQTNDPTSETFFDLLPTDGGVINIQGCGSIYKLFPAQNGLLVFAANGIWFITGSQGIGFAANDYTIVKLSSIQSISGTSFVDVQGLPMWWNNEGIYAIVEGSKDVPYGPGRGALNTGGMSVQPVTYTTIQSFYDSIPADSKKYARGAFDPLSWEVKWVYRTTQETLITDRYFYDGILTLNTVTQSFSPWTVTSNPLSITGIVYVQSPGGSTAPDPMIKYAVSADLPYFTFAEERDTTYTDWVTALAPRNYVSYFVSGPKLVGKGLFKFQSNYLNLFQNNLENGGYKIQGIWDFARSGGTGKYSSSRTVVEVMEDPEFFGTIWRRHRIRGRGLALQYKITSVDTLPFDILGWCVDQRINTST